MEDNINKGIYSLGMKIFPWASGLILFFLILSLPDVFLFSKTVPDSIWTEYFMLPFGAAWFITSIATAPSIWLIKPFSKAVKRTIVCTLVCLLFATPASLFFHGFKISFNVFTNQFIWVGISVVPPILFHVFIRLLILTIKKRYI